MYIIQPFSLHLPVIHATLPSYEHMLIDTLYIPPTGDRSSWDYMVYKSLNSTTGVYELCAIR